MKYDIKIYDENNEERETIRGLDEQQMTALKLLFIRHNIKYYVKGIYM